MLRADAATINGLVVNIPLYAAGWLEVAHGGPGGGLLEDRVLNRQTDNNYGQQCAV